ncbi:MAG: tripartite tricarboxylate transporter substrate binding protein [Betaproteobacteria bacterium]|nr:tripartite tricarboxylate transporter substrate binding protein [Betaproteobacteria bacterium]
MISRNRYGYAIRLLAGTLILMAAGTATSAQYPDKPILVVAAFTAGGDSDLAARNLTAVFPKYTGQNGVVLNKVGASGAIGSEYVKKAVPDGYTLLLARVGSQATLPALKPDLAYKWNDFTFLGLLELNPYVCVVRADSPYKTFGDLVEGIRKNPGKLKYSTAGVGTIHEMGPQMLFDILKIGKDGGIQIPYKGGGDATVALMSGEVDINCTNLGTALSFIKSGQLRALMTTTPERYKEIPNVPTAKEVGYPQLERIIGWSALYGPPGMDRKLIAYWSGVLQKVAQDPQWVTATERIGSVPRILSPEETAGFVKEQFETYDRLGKAIGLVLK